MDAIPTVQLALLIDKIKRFNFNNLTPDQLNTARNDVKCLLLLAMDMDDNQGMKDLVDLLYVMKPSD